MSTYEADNVSLHGPTFFDFVGWDSPVVLPASGVLEIGIGSGSAVILANGSVLKGIRLMEKDLTTAYEMEDGGSSPMLMLMAEDGGTISVIDNSLDVLDESHRISVDDGSNTEIDAKTVQVFWRMVNATDRRWRIHDWAGI